MAWDQQAVDKWYQENLRRGVSKTKLDDILQQKQAEYLSGAGLPLGEIQTDPLLQRIQTQQVSGGQYQPQSAAGEALKVAKEGATSEDIAKRFGGSLEPWQMLQAYKQAGVYGPIEDPQGQFYKFLPGGGLDEEAVVAYAKALENKDISLSNIPQEYREEVVKRSGTEEQEKPNFWNRLLQVLSSL